MLKHRLTFGPLLIILIGVLAWLDELIDVLDAPSFFPSETFPPGMIVLPTLVLLSAMGSREVARILRAKGVEIGTPIAITVGLFGLMVVGFTPEESTGNSGFAAGITSVGIAYIVGILYSIRTKQVDGAIAVGSGVLMIHVYMGLMLGFLLLIRREHSIWVLIWVLASVKSCDIGAYFTGTAIGKHKLIPWLSPGKTWEGLIGGMITSGLVGIGGVWLLNRSGIGAPSYPIAGVMGVCMGALGQCGDLVASLLKRDAGVKDAGTSLPGFGGVLDIIDSPIFVAPFAYWVLVLTQEIALNATASG